MDLFAHLVVPLSSPSQAQEMSKVDPYPIINIQIPTLTSASPEMAKQLYRTQGFINLVLMQTCPTLASASCFGTCQSTRLAPPSLDACAWHGASAYGAGATQFLYVYVSVSQLACVLSKEILAFACVLVTLALLECSWAAFINPQHMRHRVTV